MQSKHIYIRRNYLGFQKLLKGFIYCIGSMNWSAFLVVKQKFMLMSDKLVLVINYYSFSYFFFLKVGLFIVLMPYACERGI